MTWSEWLAAQGQQSIKLPDTLVLNDYQLVIQACIAGEGIALGWSFTTKSLVDRDILIRPLDCTVHTDHAFYVVAPKNIEVSRSEMTYIDWLTDNQ